MLHVLNRADGSQRVFTYDSVLKEFKFGWPMSFSPNAALVADEDFVYVPMATRLHAILIPDFDAFEKARAFVERIKKLDIKDAVIPQEIEKYLLDTDDSPQPDFYWGFAFPQLTTSPPLFSGEQLSVLTTDGALTSVNRFGRGGRIEQFEFRTHGKVAGAAGQHNHIAYIGSDDFNLYAINMKSGELEWRHVSGAPIETKPEVNDRDVYVALKGVGLRRVDRIGGREVWTNRDVKTFMAANHHYVYARDQNGALSVLDQRRGTTLAKLEMADWKIAVSNEWNDRFYLAANDGQLICLRHKDLPKQLVMKLAEAAKPKAPPIEEKKKEEEKKEEEKKDDKDKDKAAKVGRVAAPPLSNVRPAQALIGRRDEADRDDRRRRVGP
jgi:outer membrane protein assembly factor BamB